MSENDSESYIRQSIDYLVNFAKKVKLSTINDKFFRLEKWSEASKLFFDIFIFGIILYLLSVFHIVHYIFVWIYVFIGIFLLGFIFAKPDKRYNYALVLGIFFVLILVPSKTMQNLLLSTQITNPYDVEYDSMQHDAWNLGYLSETDDVNPYDKFTDSNRYIAWNLGYEANEKHSELNTPIDSADDLGVNNLLPALESLLDTNPIDDIIGFVYNLMDIVNWIVFIFIIGYGASGVGDFFAFKWEKIAQKVAFISLAIALLVFMYSIFGAVGIETRTIWDTIGTAWNTMLKNVGLATLDINDNYVVNPTSFVNGLFSWFPLIFLISMFSFSLYYRKRDLKSIIFAKYVSKDTAIEVIPSKFSISVLFVLLVMIIYVVGYALVSVSAVVQINEIITLTFFIASGIILVLLGLRVLIVNKEKGFYYIVKNFVSLTIIGIIILFAWFQVLQPVFYMLGLIDYETGLYMFSQDISILELDIFKQLFLVATPETLVFQILIIGVINRIYYQIRKGSLISKRKEKLESKIKSLNKKRDDITLTTDIKDVANLRNLALFSIYDKQISKFENELEGLDKSQKIPFSYFVLPTLIGAVFGSFLFADFHRFRRNISFADFWKNANLGLTYFGAGMILSIISFFSWFASILIHAINNILSLIVAGVI